MLCVTGFIFKGLVDHGFWLHLFTLGSFVPHKRARNKAKADTCRDCVSRDVLVQCLVARTRSRFWGFRSSWLHDLHLNWKIPHAAVILVLDEKIPSSFWNENFFAIVFDHWRPVHELICINVRFLAKNGFACTCNPAYKVKRVLFFLFSLDSCK